MTSIVVCGIAGQLPLAGVGLHYLQYCLGLRDLGVDVSYLEDNMAWPYHPWRNEPDRDADYSVPWLREMFGAFDLPWAYRDPKGGYHGATESEAHARCARADVLLNVSGGHWIQEHHRRATTLVYVDTDPGFTQIDAATNPAARERMVIHDLLFTFAETWGLPGNRMPDDGLEWRTTRQPVHLPFWAGGGPPGDVYTTVMNWRAYAPTEWQGEPFGQKDAEFPLVHDLPSRTGLSLEVALGGADAPREELAEAGWRIVDPRECTRDIWTFRDYIRSSRGEVTVAKQAYVRASSGWFSERSANYLAAGRPVIAQDTGWSRHLPSGEGLLAFTTAEGAEDALRAVDADPVAHGERAREIAFQHFDATAVLSKLLADIGVS